MVVSGQWDGVPFYVAFSVFAISWFLGTVTPGAPAGVGVRESVIILLLSVHIGAQASILVSLLMRMVTLLADVVFYVGSLCLEKSVGNIT